MTSELCYANNSVDRTPCSLGMCHQGNCVECILNTDCDQEETCIQGVCFNSTEVFSFMWIGDDNRGIASSAVKFAYTNYPDLEAIFYIPDLGRDRANDYNRIADEWHQNPNANPSYTPLFMGLGNHDAEKIGVVNYTSEVLGSNLTKSLPGMKNFREGPYVVYPNGYEDRNLTYSFDYKNTHFIMWNVYSHDLLLNMSFIGGICGSRISNNRFDNIDTSSNYGPTGCISDEILNWLEYDLSHTNATFKFIFYHEPAHGVPGGRHTGDSLACIYCPGNWVDRSWMNDTTPLMRDKFWSLLAKYNVTAAFMGHQHTNTLTWANDLYGGNGAVYEVESGFPPKLSVVQIREANATLRMYNAYYSNGAYHLYEPFGPIILNKDPENHAPKLFQHMGGGETGFYLKNKNNFKFEVGQSLGTYSNLWFEAKDNDIEDNLTFSFNNLPDFLAVNDPDIKYSYGAKWEEMYRRILLTSNKFEEDNVGNYSFDIEVSDGEFSDSRNLNISIMSANNPAALGASIPNNSIIQFPMNRAHIYFFCQDNESGPNILRYNGYYVKHNGEKISCCSVWHSYSWKELTENLALSDFFFQDDWDGIKDVIPGKYEITFFCGDKAGHRSNNYTLTMYLSNGSDDTPESPIYGSWPTNQKQLGKLERINFWSTFTPTKDMIDVTKDGVSFQDYELVTASANGSSISWGTFALLFNNLPTGTYQVKINTQTFTYYIQTNPTCSDGIQNQDETGVDCGGTCPPCSTPTQGIIYVDSQLTTDCTNYNPQTRTCGTGTNQAYNTLTEATTTATAGDNITIREGTYDEIFKPTNSGTQANPIIYKSYNDEQVLITGTAYDERAASHPSDPNYYYGPIWIEDTDHLIIKGLTFNNLEGFGRITHSDHNTFENCNFTSSSTNWIIGLNLFESNNNKFINNHIQGASDNFRIIHSNNNLFENNTFHHGRHVLLTLKCSSNNVIRNNYLYNEVQKAMEVLDCEQPTMFDHYNIPYYQDTTITNQSKHNLIERNTFAYTAPDNGDGPFNHIQYAGQDSIIRNNLFYNSNGISIGMTIYGTEASYNVHNRIYNNIFYNNIGGIVTSGNYKDYQIHDNIFLNNIIYKNSPIPLGWADNHLSGSQISHKTMQDFLFKNNNIINENPGETDAIYDSYNHRISLQEAQTNYPQLYKENLETNPQFLDETNHNFNLQPDSPMIDAGSYLTKTTSAGSGTTMQVEDAKYFYDGNNIQGEQGDMIQLENGGTARITNINYATNTLTLDTSLTWDIGEGVSLKYKGLAPDIGAYEYPELIVGTSIKSDSETPSLSIWSWFKGLLTGKTIKAITGNFLKL